MLNSYVLVMRMGFLLRIAPLTLIFMLLLSSRPGYSQSYPDAAAELSIPRSLGPVVDTSASLPSEPLAAVGPVIRPIEGKRRSKVNWEGILRQSACFLAVEQGFRLGTQGGTRSALKGNFIDDWFKSVTSTSGWGDGDDFLTNYIGHPMAGSVASNIFVNNDSGARELTFSWESPYWDSRLKAMAWAAIYSTQFELGPISEASLGNVGSHGNSMSGFVDLVVTPLGGFGWQVGEDVLDKYLITWIERKTQNRWILLLSRSFLNPTRSFANLMRLEIPWHRETRPGIWNR